MQDRMEPMPLELDMVSVRHEGERFSDAIFRNEQLSPGYDTIVCHVLP